jgi:hypothetical protein
MVKKKKVKLVGAPKPLGAASPAQLMTREQKIERLKSMAEKMVPKAQRKAFVKQGVESLDREDARRRNAADVNALLEDVKAVLNKHGVAAAHVIVKTDVSSKDKEMGISRWASTMKIGPEGTFELLGALTNSIQGLSSTGFVQKRL